MKVFKFGGAALKDTEGLKNAASIISKHTKEPLVVVVSAMGQTTNKLEKIVEHYYRHQRETASQLLYSIQHKSNKAASLLIDDPQHPVFNELYQLYAEMKWLLGEKAYQPYDYYYDQLVSLGEIISSLILNAYLNKMGIQSKWLDVRKVFCTDDTYRDARINWEISQKQVSEKVAPLLKKYPVIVTQGFIGSTTEGKTTTLGREGSDFSAALFANMLDAKSLTIWKDVEGLKNADPRIFKDSLFIDRISYNEVIEMAYYGAHVIHPKTIKPLQNKGIPLLVKCFLDAALPGTVVNNQNGTEHLPPIIVLKKKQVLITVITKDFSFISEENLSALYNIFYQLKIKPNLMQTGAISCSFCIDQRADKIEILIKALHSRFKISYNESLEILTIRHYESEMIHRLTEDRQILLEQKSPQTIQLVLR